MWYVLNFHRQAVGRLRLSECVQYTVLSFAYTVKPVLGDPCFGRLTCLGEIGLQWLSTYSLMFDTRETLIWDHLSWDHLLVALGAVSQNRFYCSLLIAWKHFSSFPACVWRVRFSFSDPTMDPCTLTLCCLNQGQWDMQDFILLLFYGRSLIHYYCPTQKKREVIHMCINEVRAH